MANTPTEPWLKLRKSLLRSPKIHQLAASLGTSLGDAFHLACLWLDYLDTYSDNGVTNVTPQFLETYFSCANFYTAFAQIGWIDCTETGHVYAIDYEKHNGQNAKRRMQDAERKAKSRAAKVTQKSRKSHTNVTEESQKSHDRERERERINNINHNSISNPPTITQRATPQHTTTLNRRTQQDCNANRRYDL
jgi:hypothetical protein